MPVLENSEHHFDSEQSLQERSVSTFHLNSEFCPYQMDNSSTAETAGNKIWQILDKKLRTLGMSHLTFKSSPKFD